MPRKRTLWFRFYVEAIHDRKLRRQNPAVRWLWVVVLAIARKSPIPGFLLLADEGTGPEPITVADLADEAALKSADVRKGLDAFVRLGMLCEDEAIGALRVVKWQERQFESDDTTKRTRKHRSQEQPNEQGGNVPTSAEGTSFSHARATEVVKGKSKSPVPETEAKKTRGDSAEPPPTPDEEFPEDACRLTRELATVVKRNGHKVPTSVKTKRGWFLEIDRMIRLDLPQVEGATVDDIASVIAWLGSPGCWWQPHIQSATKFRQQFTTLLGQMRRDSQRADSNGSSSQQLEPLDEHGVGRGVM